jgi:hypothetical protein
MDTWVPLPEEDDPRWDDVDDAWADAERLIAASSASGAHGWRRVAVRVFEHAADWDLHGMMQSIRHGPERAFGASERAHEEFARRLEPLSTHGRAGTRLWVVRELGILRQLSSLPYLVWRSRDLHPAVAEEALLSIEMLGQCHPTAIEALHAID